jgi:hypothetical protein
MRPLALLTSTDWFGSFGSARIHPRHWPTLMSFEPIENYGVIGNMRSIALVGVNGSIDFLCYPNFDSPTVFAALLDDERGGCFQIQPQLKKRRVRQLYLPDTNILLTRFLADEGVAELTDYMPIGTDGEQPNEIIRTLAVIRGEVDFNMRCRPRFDYSRCGYTVDVEEGCAIFSPASDTCPPMALYSAIPLQQHSQDVTSQFTLRAGEKVTFVFGNSTAAQISRDDESGTLYLNYNYSNRPKATIRDRSAIHDGAARLRIISVPERLLQGEYWTGRCTTGDMSLKLRSRQLVDTFSVRRT